MEASVCLLYEEYTVRAKVENRESIRHCKNSSETPDWWTKVVTLGENVVRSGEILDIT